MRPVLIRDLGLHENSKYLVIRLTIRYLKNAPAAHCSSQQAKAQAHAAVLHFDFQNMIPGEKNAELSCSRTPPPNLPKVIKIILDFIHAF